jgi:hypothetical protein
MSLLDPLRESLEILHLEGTRWSLAATHAGGQRVRAEPFDASELDLHALWTGRIAGNTSIVA